MACDEAVHAAAILILAELIDRWYRSRHDSDHYFKDTSFDDFKNHTYITFFVVSMCSTLFYVKPLNSVSIPVFFEPYVPYLYLCDSVAAVGLGVSLCYQNRRGVLASMVVLTNFFLLHILHTLFSKKGGSLVRAYPKNSHQL